MVEYDGAAPRDHYLFGRAAGPRPGRLRCGDADPPASSADARPRAVLRTAGHAVQRVPPDQSPGRAGPSRRSGHLPDRPRRRAAEPAHLPRPAAAVRAACRDRTLGGEGPPRRVDALHRGAPGPGRRLRRGALARGNGAGRRLGGAVARRPAPLRHALEPAAAARQLQVQRLAPPAPRLRQRGTADGERIRRRHHHLPGAAGHGDRDGSRLARHPDRERDGRRRRRSADPQRGRDPPALAPARRCAARALHRYLRGVSRPRSAVRQRRPVSRSPTRRRGCSSSAAAPTRSRRPPLVRQGWAPGTSSSPASSRRARSRRLSPPRRSWHRRESAAPIRRSRSTRICARACRSWRPTC